MYCLKEKRERKERDKETKNGKKKGKNGKKKPRESSKNQLITVELTKSTQFIINKNENVNKSLRSSWRTTGKYG